MNIFWAPNATNLLEVSLVLSAFLVSRVPGKWAVDEAPREWNCIYVVRDESACPLFKQREISANEEEACTLAGLFNLTEFLIKLLFVLKLPPPRTPPTSSHSVDVIASH